MFAEIKRIVDEDISIRVNQIDVILEAITNAIHANATEINCYFNSFDNPIKPEDSNIFTKRIDTIKVTDNGDGMNDLNYDSFINYRTDYKKALGCKGVGRFVFLKVYNNAHYISKLLKEQEERSFKFDNDFDTENIKKTTVEVEENYTEISLTSISSNYLNPERHIDRRIDLDLIMIKEKVLLHLIPTLFFFKKKGVNITITFIDSTSENHKEINHNDIPDFKEKSFQIKDRDRKSFKFILNHHIENIDGKLHSFYCANNRTVCDFSDKDFKLTLPYGYSGYFLLESEYFDTRVNNERNDFSIFPVKTDMFSTISWETINEELKKVITGLVKIGIPQTEKINKAKITEIQEERPYLINYIDESDIDIAGFMDKKKLIDNAKKKFDIAKEKILATAGKPEYSDEELHEAIELAQNELVSYVTDRLHVIDRLKKLLDKKERVEAVIHNLFMEKKSQDDYFCVGKNNLWLLDDRYTTYTYAASDKRIKEVLDEIGEESNDVEIPNDKPDLSLFFSHNPNNPERLKSVLIEIKPFDFKSKPDRKKHAGIQQLVDYVKAFKNKEKIDEISAFLVTDIDEKLAERLKGDDYVPLFSLETPIFHRFFRDLGISIYVISASTIIKDAEARNKVFLDIIKKQNRLLKFIKT